MIARVRPYGGRSRRVCVFQARGNTRGCAVRGGALREVAATKRVAVRISGASLPFITALCPITRILHSVSSLCFSDYAQAVGFSRLSESRRDWRRFHQPHIGQTFPSLWNFLRTKEACLQRVAPTCVIFSSSFFQSVDGRASGRKLSALRHLYRYLLLDKQDRARSHA